MNDIGYTIIGAAMLVISIFIMLLVACRCFNRLNKQAHYQRRKEYFRQQLARQRNRFLFDMKINKTIPQAVKESKQEVKYKGYFTNSRILRIWYTDRPSDWYYIYPPDIDGQITRLIKNYSSKSNVEAITLECEPYLIPLVDKTKSKE